MRKKLFILSISLVIGLVGLVTVKNIVLAEQSGSSPESGATSRIKTIYDSLVSLTHGSESAGGWGDWGVMWNRIRSAAEWVPTGDADEADVASGKTFYKNSRTQKTGTAAIVSLANMFNGSDTGGSFPGGSQANGGVDRYNNGDPPAAGSYSATWTACNVGNNYCGTGLASADAKDGSTNLIWSLPCNGSGCSSFSDSSPLFYSWNDSGGNNNSKTAQQLCASGSHGESGWFLPHQLQLMQAYIDGAYGNLETISVVRDYWSATTRSSSTDAAWEIVWTTGYTDTMDKSNTIYVRCVRPAN